MNDGSSTTHRASREEILKEFRVRELLEAARRVIGRYGFQGATIDRVADEAKVAKGTIYLYFTNKDDLMFTAVVDGVRGMNEQVIKAAEGLSSPLQQLKRMVGQLFRVLDSNQDFLKALIMEPSFANLKQGNPRAEELRRVFAAYLDYLAGVIQKAAACGEIRNVDPHLAAFMLDEMVVGSLRRRMLELATTAVEADADAVLDLFLNGIAARNGSAPK
jgi:AcrR family transcriptional regulator